jgi:hypothetical protein
MRKENQIEKIRKDVLSRARKLPHFDKLVFVYLFGSRASGKNLKTSDTDICFYYDLERKELNEMALKIDSAFKGYDVSLFQLLPLQIRKSVLGGKLIYLSDKDKAYDIAFKTIEEYRFYKPLYEKVIA